MITRRNLFKQSVMAGSALSLLPQLLQAQTSGGLIQRAIPKTGEQLPIIGLGSSATFSSIATSEDAAQLRDVLSALLNNGGRVFDSAPSYARGTAERVAGEYVNELGLADEVFWATKLNVVPRGSSQGADPEAAWAQIENSFDIIKRPQIDLIQVHNLADLPTQMGVLRELREEGRIRYMGTTVTQTARYPELMQAMKDYDLDFIGVDYAVDNRVAAEEVLPLAQERGIATLIYVPFGRARLWSRVRGQQLPDWASEIGAQTWAQFFLKFVAAHPATTAITPATSKPTNMLDNLGGGVGELPDADMLARMIAHVDGLPQA